MGDITDADLAGTRFQRVDLSGAEFKAVDLSGARFVGADLTGVVMRGVELVDVAIDGEVSRLLVNGVDVTAFVADELDRRDPERVLMRPTDAAGFRRAWAIVKRRWDDTTTRAMGLDPFTAARLGGRRMVLHRNPAPSPLRDRRMDPPGRPRRVGPLASPLTCPGTRCPTRRVSLEIARPGHPSMPFSRCAAIEWPMSRRWCRG